MWFTILVAGTSSMVLQCDGKVANELSEGLYMTDTLADNWDNVLDFVIRQSLVVFRKQIKMERQSEL